MTVILGSQVGFNPVRPTSVCPRCGSSCLRQRKTCTEGRFICVKCNWLGNFPATRLRKQKSSHKKEKLPRQEIKPNSTKSLVKYTDIIPGLLAGLTIEEQFLKFDALEIKRSQATSSGRKTAVRNKILRIYSAFAEYTKIPCTDPDFVKIKVTDDVMQLVITAIQEEETKIRNSPRQSVSFCK